MSDNVLLTILACTFMILIGIACLATHSADPLMLLIFLVWLVLL